MDEIEPDLLKEEFCGCILDLSRQEGIPCLTGYEVDLA